MELFFGDFYRRFDCVISAQKALFRASGMLHPVDFRLWSIDLGCGYTRHGMTVADVMTAYINIWRR